MQESDVGRRKAINKDIRIWGKGEGKISALRNNIK